MLGTAYFVLLIGESPFLHTYQGSEYCGKVELDAFIILDLAEGCAVGMIRSGAR